MDDLRFRVMWNLIHRIDMHNKIVGFKMFWFLYLYDPINMH